MAKFKAPQVLTANDLVEGDSIFLGSNGWVRDIALARVAESARDAEALSATGAAAESANIVVGPYLIDVRLEAGRPVPLLRRERIRADREPTFVYAAPDAIARAA